MDEDILPGGSGWTKRALSRPGVRAIMLAGLLFINTGGFRPLAGLPVSDMLFILGAFVSLFLWRSTIHMPKRVFIGGALVIAGGLLSSANAYDAVESVTNLVKFGFVVFVFFAIFPIVFTTQKSFFSICWLTLCGGAVSGLAAALEFKLGHRLLPGQEALPWRMLGLSEHPVELGNFCAISISIGLCLMVTQRSTVQKIIITALMVASSLGIILSVSLTAAVCAAFVLSAYMVYRRFFFRLAIMSAIVVGGLTIFNTVFSLDSFDNAQNVFDRVEAYLDSSSLENTTVGERVDTDRAAFDRIAENPLVGVGTDLESALTSADLVVHNMFLLAWFETGVLGLVGILILYFSPIIRLLRIYFIEKSNERIFIATLILLWGCTFLIALTGPVLFQRINWLPVSMIEVFLISRATWRRSANAPPINNAATHLISSRLAAE